jgi:hypothetical protein
MCVSVLENVYLCVRYVYMCVYVYVLAYMCGGVGV